MKKDDTNQIFSYLHKTGKTLLIAIIIMVVSALMFFLFLKPSDLGFYKVHHTGSLLLAVFFFAIGFLLIVSEPKERKKVRTMLKQYDPTFLVSDFDGARAFFDDHLRVGRAFLYSPEAEKVIPISAISKIVIYRNGERTLCVCAITGSECQERLYTFGEGQYDAIFSETQMLTNGLAAINRFIEFQQL